MDVVLAGTFLSAGGRLRVTPDEATGELVARGVTDADVHGEEGLRLWAGRAAEPF